MDTVFDVDRVVNMLFQKKVFLLLMLTVGAIILPFFVGTYYTYLATTAFIFGIFALSYNLILGYMGKVTFAHAIFFGVGAYTVAIGMNDPPLVGPVSFWVTIPIAIILAAGVAAFIGFVACKLKDIYFTMFTLATGSLTYTLIVNLREITEGIDGIIIPYGTNINLLLCKIDLDATVNFYYFTVLVFLISTIILLIYTSSNFGRMVKSVKMNEERVRFVGVNQYRIQLTNWIISSLFASVAGCLYALSMHHITPSIAGVTTASEPLIMSLLGGMNTFAGPIVGSFVWIFVEDFLSAYIQYWHLAMGVITILIALYFSEGIVGYIKEFIQD